MARSARPIACLGFRCFHLERPDDDAAPVEALFEFRRLAMAALIRPPQVRWLRRRVDAPRRQLLAVTIKTAR